MVAEFFSILSISTMAFEIALSSLDCCRNPLTIEIHEAFLIISSFPSPPASIRPINCAYKNGWSVTSSNSNGSYPKSLITSFLFL